MMQEGFESRNLLSGPEGIGTWNNTTVIHKVAEAVAEGKMGQLEGADHGYKDLIFNLWVSYTALSLLQ